MVKNGRHTYKFGVIGNGSFLSYIDLTGNVVWQCWPRFDSSFVFGGLLDDKKGGDFFIRPEAEKYSSTQRYVQNTNILVTTFECSDGSFEVTDFAPRFSSNERYHKPLMLLRKVKRISGHPLIKVVCHPTGSYGAKRGVPCEGSNHISYSGLDADLRLTTNASKTYILDEKAFSLTQDLYFVLTWGEPFEAPLESTFEDFLRRTDHYWKKWVERCRIPNFASTEVIRSALLLKLHQYDDTGGIIASGTTSLPEHFGSERTWDYRYCWMRDSFFTLAALDSLNHFEELQKYSHFIQNIIREETVSIQPVYRLDGQAPIEEYQVPLKGYMGSQPVRIGNAAYLQVQNDVYGQVILSLLPLFLDERIRYEDSRPPIFLIEKALELLKQNLNEPDAGIWEFRGKKRIHCTTALFHWAGASAAVRVAHRYQNSELHSKAMALKQEAALLIEKCFDNEQKVYKVSPDVGALNASDLLLISMNYLRGRPERAQEHLKSLEKHLRTPEGYFYRYQEIDDFGETKSAFLICCYWYIEALAKMGRLEEAIQLFDLVNSTANHLGILSEDVDPIDGSQWGNFAQTYSHVGLINAAFRIQKELDYQLYETQDGDINPMSPN